MEENGCINNKIFVGYEAIKAAEEDKRVQDFFNHILEDITLHPLKRSSVILDLNSDNRFRQYFAIRFERSNKFIAKHNMQFIGDIVTHAELTDNISWTYLYCNEDLEYLREFCIATRSMLLEVNINCVIRTVVLRGDLE